MWLLGKIVYWITYCSNPDISDDEIGPFEPSNILDYDDQKNV